VDFAAWVKKYRKDRGWTQRRFATEAGLTEAWVRKVESREIAKPPDSTLETMATKLGVPLDALLAVPPSVRQREQHRVVIPATMWAELEQAADILGTTPQAYALTLMERALSLPQHETAKSSQRTSPASPAPGGEVQAEDRHALSRGRSRPAKKHH
jgi:transcriptional regulator with XRE-family HTH domain